MLRLIGLNDLSQEALLLTLAPVVVCAIFAGIISDMIMRDAGYGIIGNAALTLFGAFIGLAAWTQFIGSMRQGDIAWVAASAGFGALCLLLLFALFKRAVS